MKRKEVVVWVIYVGISAGIVDRNLSGDVCYRIAKLPRLKDRRRHVGRQHDHVVDAWRDVRRFQSQHAHHEHVVAFRMADEREVQRLVIDLNRQQALDHIDEAIDAAVDIVAYGALGINDRPVDLCRRIIACECWNQSAVTGPVESDEQPAVSSGVAERRSKSRRFGDRGVEAIAETVYINGQVSVPVCVHGVLQVGLQLTEKIAWVCSRVIVRRLVVLRIGHVVRQVARGDVRLGVNPDCFRIAAVSYEVTVVECRGSHVFLLRLSSYARGLAK